MLRRIKKLNAKEAIMRMQLAEPVNLDLYRAKSEKIELLVAAMETFDPDIIQRVMIFLRTTLNDTAFREVLMFYPDATEHFIDYLTIVQEYEQLIVVYLWLGRHDDAHMVEIAMAIKIRSPEQKLAALRRCANNEQLDFDVSYPLKNYVGLLERQISIENSDSRERSYFPRDGRTNAPLPFTPTLATLYYINLYHFKCFEGDIRNPNAFKHAMSLTEKEFVWVTISAHVHRERWQEIEKILEVKSGLFAQKVAYTPGWELLFKLFFRAPTRPPLAFLEKVCKSIIDAEVRQKIAKRYSIPTKSTAEILNQSSRTRIPFLGRKNDLISAGRSIRSIGREDYRKALK